MYTQNYTIVAFFIQKKNSSLYQRIREKNEEVLME